MYATLTLEDFLGQLNLCLVLAVIMMVVSLLFMAGAIPELNPTIHSDRVLGAYLFGGDIFFIALFCQ